MCGHKQQSGLSLVELMVTMALSVMLLGSVINVFVSTKTTFRTQETLSRIQENARYALSTIRDELLQGGFIACSPSGSPGARQIKTLLNTASSSSDPFDYSHSIFGVENGQLNNDEITIRYPDGRSRLPLNALPSATNNFTLQFDPAYYNTKNQQDQLQQWEVASVTDCVNTLVFLVTNDPTAGTIEMATGVTSPKKATAGLRNQLSPKSASANPLLNSPVFQPEVYRLNATRFFIDTTTGTPKGTTSRTLYRQNGLQAKQPLVDGVQRFNITYGLDTDANGSADDFRDWDDLTTPAEQQAVVAVRFELDINNGQPIADTHTRTAGVANNPADFKTFRTTIKLRNRPGVL